MMDDITYDKRYADKLVPNKTPSEKREVRRQYYAKNREHILSLCRQKHAKVPYVRCEVCDVEVIKYNLNLHEKSQKHMLKTSGIKPFEKKDDEEKKREKELKKELKKELDEFEKWQKGNIQKVLQLQELVKQKPYRFMSRPITVTFD